MEITVSCAGWHTLVLPASQQRYKTTNRFYSVSLSCLSFVSPTIPSLPRSKNPREAVCSISLRKSSTAVKRKWRLPWFFGLLRSFWVENGKPFDERKKMIMLCVCFACVLALQVLLLETTYHVWCRSKTCRKPLSLSEQNPLSGFKSKPIRRSVVPAVGPKSKIMF